MHASHRVSDSNSSQLLIHAARQSFGGDHTEICGVREPLSLPVLEMPVNYVATSDLIVEQLLTVRAIHLQTHLHDCVRRSEPHPIRAGRGYNRDRGLASIGYVLLLGEDHAYGQ